jgi:SAM-dependent methyltransferase
MTGWDAEYERSGIPSSFRDDPSGVVTWFAQSWPLLRGGRGAPRRGLDVGCGTARNTLYLAELGLEMTGFDSSTVAIEMGRRRVAEAGVEVDLRVHDLQSGLPAGDCEVDVLTDVFVYKHQLQPDVRRRYRAEIDRVLAPGGRVLISLAEPGDGYYSQCPPSSEPGAGPNAIIDPVTGVGSVLFSLTDLTVEMEDRFELELAWRKAKEGSMHEGRYLRRTLATIWRRATDV